MTFPSHPALNHLPQHVVLWGGTGQAKVARPIMELFGAEVVAVFDDTPGLARPFEDVPLYEGWAGFERWQAEWNNRAPVGFCVAIGNPHGRVRLRLHDRMVGAGLSPVTIAHPSAVIAENALIGEGTQIMAGAVVMAQARIGRQCIINTNASVDHEDVLGDGVEVAPGATLCGQVTVGVNGWICAGATVLPGLSIGDDAIVGAGATVIRDVPRGTTVVGSPASRVIRTYQAVR